MTSPIGSNHPRFLRSKLLAPVPHPDSVARQRLSDVVAASDAPVWLLSAPAGYGKTTVLTQVLSGISGRVGWVTLDHLDNDAVRFWTHLIAATITEPTLQSDILEQLNPENINVIVDELLAYIESLDEQFYLVLDDMHEIVNQDILVALSPILSHPPRSLTLIIATRLDPALPIGRLRTRGQLLELRVPELAFTSSEAAEVFDDSVSAEVVASLVADTEGWPTALRMLAVTSTVSRSPEQVLREAVAADSDLADFLAAEVLSVQSTETRQFLIETSLLTDLEPGMCDTLTGQVGSLSTLRQLSRKQVFTELIDPETDTYRYHPLFREFLRSEARALDPKRLQHLHATAAQLFADRDDPTPAITHAVAARNYELALATLNRHYIPYSQAGHISTVNDWLEIYGLDRCRNDPQLRVAVAWVMLNTRQYDEVVRWLETPEGAPAYSEDLLVEAHATLSHRARHLGNLDTALNEAKIAFGHVTDSKAQVATVATAALGMASVLAGTASEEVLNAAVSVGLSRHISSSVVIGYSYLALLVSEDLARIEEAEAFADQALGFVTSPTLERFHQPAVAYLVKSRAALSDGRIADAEKFIELSESIALGGKEPLILVLAYCQRAEIAFLRGSLDDARAHLRDADVALGEAKAEHLRGHIRRTRNRTRFARPNDRHLPPGALELTERELEVLRLLPYGLARKVLAEQLHVSENTIKTHLTSIRSKLGVKGNPAQIVERARELELIPNRHEPDDGAN